MSIDTAAKYAKSVGEGIQSMTEWGGPFGLIDQETDEWTNDCEDYIDWRNNPDTRWTEASAYDYLGDVLDVEYRVTRDREYRSAQIMIAMGGPNAWIDTKTRELIVAWYSAPFSVSLPRDFVDGLDSALDEMWGE